MHWLLPFFSFFIALVWSIHRNRKTRPSMSGVPLGVGDAGQGAGQGVSQGARQGAGHEGEVPLLASAVLRRGCAWRRVWPVPLSFALNGFGSSESKYSQWRRDQRIGARDGTREFKCHWMSETLSRGRLNGCELNEQRISF